LAQASKAQAAQVLSSFPQSSGARMQNQRSLVELANLMPILAGRTLAAPKLYSVQWCEGRILTVEDDPDRTALPWTPPAFVWEDPTTCREATTSEDLQLPHYPIKDVSFARVLRNVMKEEDCGSLLDSINDKGYTPALINIGNGDQQYLPDVRDGHRVIVDSPELAWWLFEKLRPHLPERLPNGSRLVGLNERCRFLCYTPGQFFEEHCDGKYRRPGGHPRSGDSSFVTVQLYLHDVPKEFGGATTFFPGNIRAIGHQPEAGSVLLFTQDLLHEGSLVTDGLKYTMRTEAMYAPAGSDPEVTTWPPAPIRASGA